jgi:hypothetical protein
MSMLGLATIAPEAGAATMTGASYWGCNSTVYHYRLTEFRWDEGNGHLYKTHYLDIIDKNTGAMVYQNAVHGWVEWFAHVDTVYQDGNGSCFFRFSAWPGFGWYGISPSEYIDQFGVRNWIGCYVNETGCPYGASVGSLKDNTNMTELIETADEMHGLWIGY